MAQLPTPELGEMELTWQEIMSITELQVSGVAGAGEGKGREAESLAGTEAGAGTRRAQSLKLEMFQALGKEGLKSKGDLDVRPEH